MDVRHGARPNIAKVEKSSNRWVNERTLEFRGGELGFFGRTDRVKDEKSAIQGMKEMSSR